MVSNVAVAIGAIVFIAGTFAAAKSRFASLTGGAAMAQGACGVVLIGVLLASRSIRWWTADYSHIALAIFMAASGSARYFLAARTD